MKCASCGKVAEVRPYGPGGSLICFDCAFGTPESKKATEKAFAAQLNAAGPVVVIGGECGPVPAPPELGGRVLS